MYSLEMACHTQFDDLPDCLRREISRLETK